MLNNDSSHHGSVLFELLIGLALIVGVSVGFYQIQHPHQSQTQVQISSQQ